MMSYTCLNGLTTVVRFPSVILVHRGEGDRGVKSPTASVTFPPLSCGRVGHFTALERVNSVSLYQKDNDFFIVLCRDVGYLTTPGVDWR